jgi:hypothetical protein
VNDSNDVTSRCKDVRQWRYSFSHNRVAFWEGTPGTRRTVKWVGPRVSLDSVNKRRILPPSGLEPSP